MSEKLPKTTKKFKINTTFQTKEKEESNSIQLKDSTLIGNKRERTSSFTIETICDYCKMPIYSKYLKMNSFENTKEYIINEFKIKDNDFQNNLSKTLEELFPENIKEKNIVICNNCIEKKFIKGGVENLLGLNCDNNNEFEESINSENFKTLRDINTLNLQLIISQIKNIKIKFVKLVENITEIFNNTAIRVMFSNNKDSFMKIKEEMEKCKDKLEEINKIFEQLINDYTSKEIQQNLYISNLFNNNEKIFKKEKLSQLLKNIQMENTSSPNEAYIKNKTKDLEKDFNFNKKNELSKKILDFSTLKNKNFEISNNFNFSSAENLNNTKVNNHKSDSLNLGQDKNSVNQVMNLPNFGLDKQYLLYYLEKIQYLKKRLGLNNQTLQGFLANSFRNKDGTNLELNLKKNLNIDQSELSNNIFSNNLISHRPVNPKLLDMINNNTNNNDNINNINYNNNINNNSNIDNNINITSNINNNIKQNNISINNDNDNDKKNNNVNNNNYISDGKNNNNNNNNLICNNENNTQENKDDIKNNESTGNIVISKISLENNNINNSTSNNDDNQKKSNSASPQKLNNKNNLPSNLNIEPNYKMDMKKIENSIKIQNLINSSNNNNIYNNLGNNNSEMFSELLEFFKLSPSIHYLLYDNYFNNHSNINNNNLFNLPSLSTLSNLSEIKNDVNLIQTNNSQNKFNQKSSLINKNPNNINNNLNNNKNTDNNNSNNLGETPNPNNSISFTNSHKLKHKKEGTSSLLVNKLNKTEKEKKIKQENNVHLSNNESNSKINNCPNVSINIPVDSNEENNKTKINLQQNSNNINVENKNTNLENKGNLNSKNNNINANNSEKSENINENEQKENTKNDISIFLNQS